MGPATRIVNRYTEAQREVLPLIESLGLDPKQIAVNGIDHDGYDRFTVDETGARLIGADSSGRVRYAWPEHATGEIVDQIVHFARVMNGGI